MSACASALALALYDARERHFGTLTEPQWRILLDLRVKGDGIPVTSTCIASGAPASTALRHLNELLDAGFVERHPVSTDKRSDSVALSTVATERFEAFEETMAAA